MGFQDMPKVVHMAASAKGGKIKIAKGLGLVPVERRKEIASMGGKAKNADISESRTKQEEEPRSNDRGLLERVLGDLDEQVQE